MKKLLKKSLYILLPILLCAVAYLCISFFYLDINPENWSRWARLLVYIYSIVGLGYGIFLAQDLNEEKPL